MAIKNLFNANASTLERKALEYKNSFVQLAVVLRVDTEKGMMDVRLSSNKLLTNIPYKSMVQATGNVDISVPIPGDIVYIYQDSVIHGMHLGPAPRDYQFLIQDKTVSAGMESTDPLGLPHVREGERYIRSAKGGSLLLTDNVTISDALTNRITLDSNEDQIDVYSSTTKINTFGSEIRLGLTKRYNVPDEDNPDFHPLYDTIIGDPGSDTGRPMTEFTVYLGKTLLKELDDVAQYLTGSDRDPNSQNFDFDIGKDATPKIIFSLSDTAVTNINGDDFPKFQDSHLNMLIQIAENFTMMVNQAGSTLIGKLNSNKTITGITMNTTPGAESMTLGLGVGNSLIFQSLGGVILQTPNIGGSSETVNARLQLYANSSIQLANNTFNLFVNNDPDDTYMSLAFSSDPKFLMRADQDGFNLVSGDSIWVFEPDGTVQLNQKVINIGQPNLTAAKPYETAMLGNTTAELLKEILEILGSLAGNLTVPLIGLAVYPPTLTTAATEIISKLTAIATKYGITTVPAPGPITPGQVLPSTKLLSRQVNIGS